MAQSKTEGQNYSYLHFRKLGLVVVFLFTSNYATQKRNVEMIKGAVGVYRSLWCSSIESISILKR